MRRRVSRNRLPIVGLGLFVGGGLATHRYDLLFVTSSDSTGKGQRFTSEDYGGAGYPMDQQCVYP